LTKRRVDLSFGLGFVVVIIAAAAFVAYSRPRATKAPATPPAGLAQLVDSLDLSRSRGDRGARDTLIEITDFYCQGCALANDRLHGLLDTLVERGQLVHIVWEVAFQRGSSEVSAAAQCAYRQRAKHYWTYRNTLFAAQRAVMASFPVREGLLRLAPLAGVDSSAMRDCLERDAGTLQSQVEAVTSKALEAGVPFTPVFWLNARQLPASALVTELRAR
jgi:protein-disulfide isomerase